MVGRPAPFYLGTSERDIFSGQGRVTLKLGPFGKRVHKLVATVSASGYTSTRITLRVR